MPIFRNAVFHITVASLNDLPNDSVSEIAFAGRSNAGKSSAINTLAGHTRLAFVSKTPGRTQHLNYFSLGEGKYFVDLPGYGFAKAPAEIRSQWENLLEPYLIHRSPLAGLVLIMDSRHPLTELDIRMINWFAQTGKPIHILLSKADKLSRQEQVLTIQRVKNALKNLGDSCSIQLFSSLKHTGIEEAETVLGKWLGIEPDDVPRIPAKTSLAEGKVPRPRKRSAMGWSARVASKAKVPRQKQNPPAKE